MMKLDKKRAKRALKNTIIVALLVLAVQIVGMVYLMIKWNLPFMEAMPDSWMFSGKGIVLYVGGLVGFFFFVYFAEYRKE